MEEEKIITLPFRDQAASIIRSRIFRGELEPGTLLSERILSEELGISTTPVKEALRELNAEGLVKTLPRRGTVVADVRGNLECLSYIRAALEGLSANFAAKNISKEQEMELSTITERIRICTERDDAAGVAEQNDNLHRLLREAAGSLYLSNLLQQLGEIDASIRDRSVYRSREERERVCGEHLAIAAAVLSHDREKADALMNRHIREGYRRLNNSTEEAKGAAAGGRTEL